MGGNALGFGYGLMLQKDLSEEKKSPLKGVRSGGFSSSTKDSQTFAIVANY